MRILQEHWFAVRRAAVRVGPGVFSDLQFGRIRQGLCGYKAFERREPVFVVARAIIRFATIRGGPQFLSERSRPFLPREVTLCGERYSQRESLRLPRLGKDGATVFIPGQAGQGTRVRRAQDRSPTYRGKRCRAGTRRLPRVLAQ